MGLVLDSSVFIAIERGGDAGTLADLESEGPGFLSAITAAELLIGVQRANTPERLTRRSAFVEQVLARFPILDFNLEVARLHALVRGQMPRDESIGAHDLIIGVTALYHGFGVLTGNVKDFSRIPGLTVFPFQN